MVMSERSTVVGIFTDDLNANLAADELRRVGFSDDEISIARKKDEVGGIRANLKKLFQGQEATPLATANDFMRMGVSEQDAHFYQNELDAGRTIELVRIAGQENEVLDILHKYGGITSNPSSSNVQSETGNPPVAPDLYDPVVNRDADDSMMPPGST